MEGCGGGVGGSEELEGAVTVRFAEDGGGSRWGGGSSAVPRRQLLGEYTQWPDPGN